MQAIFIMSTSSSSGSTVCSPEAYSYLLIWTQQLISHYSETMQSPEKGWEKAHHPTPKHLKGTDFVWMKREHHAIHGILQSRAFGEPCTSGLYSPLMKDTVWWNEHQHWLSLAGKKAGAARKDLWSANKASVKVRQRPVRLTNIDTGKTYDFASLKEATATLGLKSNLTDHLAGRRGRCGRYTGTYI